MEKEVRVFGVDKTGLKVEKRKDGEIKISGYAAVFGKDSEDMGFIERIQKGAFKDALKRSPDAAALFNHDPNHIFGRAGVNLRMQEDSKGLWMEVDPIDTSTYRMVAENIRAGLVSQQSFAFTVQEDEWDDDFSKRTITKVDRIFDVSPVTYPAYPDTTVALRSMESHKKKRDSGPTPKEKGSLEPLDGSPTIADQEAIRNLNARFDLINSRIEEILS